MNVQHIIITRSTYDAQPADFKRRRRKLMSELTGPSIAAQTAPVLWSILCGQNETGVGAEFGARCTHRKGRNWWAAAVEPHILPDTTHVLTTRMDDDDVLAPDFCARVQRLVDPAITVPTLFILPYGYRADLATGRCQPSYHTANQFCSVLSTVRAKRHALGEKHGKMPRVFRTLHVDNQPAWVWTRHKDAKSPGGRKTMHHNLSEITDVFPCLKAYCRN